MKKLIALALALVMLLSLAACTPKDNSGNEGKTEKTIAVIAKGESHAFWQAVKAGAEAAAKEAGYTITFRGPQSESAKDLPSQIEMVQTALSSNVAGLVLATIGEGFTDLLTQAKDKNIPVIQFDSGIWANDVTALNNANKNPILAGVATNNKKAAAVAAEKLFEAIKADIAAADKYVIGVIQHDETATGVDRAGGFIEKFTELADADASTKGKYEIAKEVKPGDADKAYVAALEALYEKKAQAIFMSNEGVVKQVYDATAAAEGKYDAIKFCGFDAGTKQIEWIKATSGPKLIGSVAQDSYKIGYNAVKQCLAAIDGKKAENVDIGGAWYDASNIEQMMKDNLVYDG